MSTIIEVPQNECELNVNNFSFYYKGAAGPSLKNINMPIKRRSVTAMIGPSGCGKTTLLRAFNRMHDLYPGNRYEGEIVLHDEKEQTSKNILDPKIDLIDMRNTMRR